MSIKLGIISFAHGHVNAYASEIKDMNDVEIVAAWDDDGARGKKGCEAHGLNFEPDLEKLLAREDIKGVIITSETAKHADHAVAAANAGKDILLQKPMALTLEDCDRVADAVKKNGVRFSMAWQMRCDPQNQWMRESTQSGEFGKVLMVRRRHCLNTQAFGDAFLSESWHVKPEMNRGMFMDDAAHAVDWLLWMFGRPVSVMAEIDTLLDPRVPDDNGMAIFRFENGVMASLECSFTCSAADDTTNIYCEKGTILQRWGDGPSTTPDPSPNNRGLRFKKAGEKEWTTVGIATPEAHFMRIRGVTQPAVEFFQGKRGPIATAEEGRISTEMLLAAYQSSAEGRRISLKK